MAVNHRVRKALLQLRYLYGHANSLIIKTKIWNVATSLLGFKPFTSRTTAQDSDDVTVEDAMKLLVNNKYVKQPQHCQLIIDIYNF